MTRQAFLDRLRAGLRGLPSPTIAEIITDYDAHFSEGVAAGRSEAEIAAALGDPDRVIRELRAEAGLKRWEEERNPSAAANAVLAVLGLGALDILVLLPIAVPIAGTLFGFLVAALALLGVGALMFAAGPFFIIGAPIAAVILSGLGLICAGICLGCATSAATIGFVNLLVWYGRLHLRLLKPALEPSHIDQKEIVA
jgi:uncharacterized membrane protein